MPSEGIRREIASHGAVRRGAERGGGGGGRLHDVLRRAWYAARVCTDQHVLDLNLGARFVEHRHCKPVRYRDILGRYGAPAISAREHSGGSPKICPLRGIDFRQGLLRVK